jgi:hypothetical protein
MAGMSFRDSAPQQIEPTTGSVVVPEPSDAPIAVPRRGAFELKFVVDEQRAAVILSWADRHLEPDPHSDPETGHGYRVNGLYLDTPAFDVFHRNGLFKRRKFRLRRYGSESTIWLEQKRKRNGHVRKRRLPVADSDLLQRLTQPADAAWDGLWFRRRLDEHRLQPVCQVTYDRVARVGTTTDGPVRLTIDSGLCTHAADGWQVPSSALNGTSLINGQRIVELKFRETLPTLFRGLIQDLRLEPASFSKYRTSAAACVPAVRLAPEANPGAVHA